MKRTNEPNEPDVLRDAFDAQQVELPDALEPDAVVRRLKARQVKTEPKKNNRRPARKGWPRVAAIAAALAVFVTAFAVAPKWNTSKPTVMTEGAADDAAVFERVKSDLLPQFESDEALREHFTELMRSSDMNFGPTYAVDSAAGYGVVYDEAAPTTNAKSVSGATDDLAGARSYSKTNTQVSGVDEADIVKTDGRYLYLSRGTAVTIVDAETMTEVWSKKLDNEADRMNSGYENLYVGGDRLILLRHVNVPVADDENEPDEATGTTAADDAAEATTTDAPYRRYRFHRFRQQSVAELFDITDRSDPKQIGTLTQDGFLQNTRMVGDVLYTVTNYSPQVYAEKDIDDACVPRINGKKISCEDIYIRDPEENTTDYLVLTAWDTAKPDSTPSRISLLGRSDQLYCSTDTLYVADTAYIWDDEEGHTRTDLYAFSFSGTTLQLAAKGSVPGSVNDQYSMDQSGDTFRITTTNRYERMDEDGEFSRWVAVSSLYVLDRDLKEIGKLEDLANNEAVESTRFFGDTAYVVTFENTDPLFVIDLSDPKHPTVKGEVKLPGFSSYLHPVGNGYLVGIGYGGDDDGADYSTVKLSLFDVSDPAAPKEVDKLVLEDAYSSAQYDPKSVIFDEETATLGFPVTYEVYSQGRYSYLGARYVFQTVRVENGGFTDQKAFLHREAARQDNWYPTLFRGVTIGESLYTITNEDVKAFHLATSDETDSLTLSDVPQSFYYYYHEPYWDIIDD
ncbi:MAG: beta-propeller domain-containing protein [Clostridia bacterium]|nr:beta-propeller domain-containing protein [Clostridia bacterium]